MRKIIIWVVILCGFGISAKTAKIGNNFRTPDFAYPETVIKNADRVLHQSLERREWVDVVKALIQQAIAVDVKSHSALQKVCVRIDSCAQIAPVPYSSLLYSLEAELYNKIYLHDRWSYDRRSYTSEDSVIQDVQEWTGDMFCKNALNLAGKSLCDFDTLATLSLVTIDALLSPESRSASTYKYYPTVADFIAWRALDIASPYYNLGKGLIPFVYNSIATAAPLQSGNLATGFSDGVYTRLLRMHENNTAPLAAVMLSYNSFKYGERDYTYIEKAFAQLSNTPDCLPLLCRLSGDTVWKSEVEYYKLGEEYMAKYPKADYTPNLGAILADMSRQQVTLAEIKNTYTLSDTLRIPVKLQNATDARIELHDLEGRLINTVDAHGPKKEYPFENKDTVLIVNPGIGDYVLSVAAIGGVGLKSENRTNIEIKVRNVAAISAGAGIYVVSNANMAPMKSTKVDIYTGYATNRTKSGSYVTDSEGYIDSVLPKASEAVVFVKDYPPQAISLAGPTPVRQVNIAQPELRKRLKILTDRTLYHLSDTVSGCVIGYSVKGIDYHVVPNVQIHLSLYDPNGNVCSQTDVALDEMGKGVFYLIAPDEGVTGSMRVVAEYVGNDDAWQVASTQITVADYKLPTFFVDLAAPTMSQDSVLTIEGKVATYSGMAQPGLPVSLTVNYSPFRYAWWCGRNADNATFSAKSFTGVDGTYRFELGCDSLLSTPFAHGVFEIITDATLPTGETQRSITRRIVFGSMLSIRAEVPEKINATYNRDLKVTVVDALGNSVDKMVNYTIINAITHEEVCAGSFQTPEFILSATELPSASYIITFKVDDVISNHQFTIWRPTDAVPPVNASLWVPVTKFTKDGCSDITAVTVGSSYPDSWILCRLSDESGLLSQKWVSISQSNRVINIDNPKSGSGRWVSLTSIHSGEVNQEIVEITAPEPEKIMEVETISFRDHVMAGDTELWRFRFRYNDGASSFPVSAAAVMTDKALDALAPSVWNFSLQHKRYINGARFARTSSPFLGNRSIYASLPYIKNYKQFSIGVPWLCYMAEWPSQMYIKGERIYYASAPKNAAMKLKSSAAFASADGTVMEECAEDDATTGSNDEGTSVWRPAEMPLAFFMPDLKADKQGFVDVKFIVPDFNTTWKFKLLGYDHELHTAVCEKEAVASKPVMVKLAAPRFMRTGDKITLSASVYNNTDAKASLKWSMEVINPVSDSVLAIAGASDMLMKANESGMVSLDFTVPSGLDIVVIRVRATSGHHTDGEQTAIGVLPSETRVVESSNFYLSPKDMNITIDGKPASDNSRMSLSYCANPMWLAVQALPALTCGDSKNIMPTLMGIVGNSVTSHLVDTRHEIADAIRRLTESSEVRSPLEVNDNLKLMTLSSTIWKSDAQGYDNRIELLRNYLDTACVNASISEGIDNLLKLQSPSGGWKWLPDGGPSEWVTSKVLLWCGLTAGINALPCDVRLHAALSKGVAYMDSIVSIDWQRCRRDKREPALSPSIEYFYLRSLYPDVSLPKELRDMRSRIVRIMKRDWRSLNIDCLATAVMLASDLGENALVQEMIESLRQKAMKRDDRGMWYDNLNSTSPVSRILTTSRVLEAFHAVEPKGEYVDRLRQWLVGRLQTIDWSYSPATAYAVHSLITTGSDWLVDAGDIRVKIGNRVVSPDTAAALAGAFVITLDNIAGEEISIERCIGMPAWGALIQQYDIAVSDVKASACDGLSINKVVMQSAGVSAHEEIKLGSKVRVNLIISSLDDMQYVTISDGGTGCLTPADQLPGYIYSDGLSIYREPRNVATNFFVPFLPKGTHVISYDCYVTQEGTYALGMVSIQNQQAPELTAHSAGSTITVIR